MPELGERARQKHSLLWPLAFLALVIVGGIPLTLLETRQSHHRLLETQAKDLARTVAAQVAKEREVYTESVVQHLEDLTGRGTFGATSVRGGGGEQPLVPLPATFVREVAEHIEAVGEVAYRYRLISRWNLNPKMGLADGFEWRGFQRLEAQAFAARQAGADLSKAVWEPYFEVVSEGSTFELRGLFPDRAVHSRCVECHNRAEQRAWSPAPGDLAWVAAARSRAGVLGPKAFVLGELMGAISVRVQLARMEAISGVYLRRYGIVVTGFGLLLLGAGCALFLSWRAAHMATSQKLEQRNVELQRLALDLETIAKSERQAHHALKEAQSQLVQTEKLASLGQMVAGVAHEINNPLAFVINNMEVLERDAASVRQMASLLGKLGADGAQRAELEAAIVALRERADIDYALGNMDELVARTRDGLRRIERVVLDLRDFARLEHQGMSEADLNPGIESTLHMLRGRAQEGGVRLETSFGTLPLVVCHVYKINQVVLNLVANAIDACSPGGEVAVRTSIAQDESVVIEVTDTGMGIDPSIGGKIFDPFFTTKPPGKGTGLGLSISYGIVKEHGGHIAFESTPGKGTRFTVRLPVRAGAGAGGAG